MGARAAAGVVTGQFVERGIELARLEGLAGFNLFPTIPPMGILPIEDGLLG
jgi:hypothetical protein